MFTVTIHSSTQYATVYRDADEAPVATVRRRHAFDARNAPSWEAFDVPNGKRIVVVHYGGTDILLRKLERALGGPVAWDRGE